MGIQPCSSKQLIKALKKVGLSVNIGAGEGSHTKVVDPRTGHSTTVPKSKNLSFVRNEIVKWAVKLGYSEKEIVKNL